ncbi:hypothetical protein, partial [Roseateles cavernae]|uniref:hypothetical protein n=1 Tax=Roseateles cavernae TaxID=3153578 RepID=UPI0032E4338A
MSWPSWPELWSRRSIRPLSCWISATICCRVWPVSCTWREPASVRSVVSLIRVLISRAASPARW